MPHGRLECCFSQEGGVRITVLGGGFAFVGTLGTDIRTHEN